MINSWNEKFSRYFWNIYAIIYQCIFNLHDCTLKCWLSVKTSDKFTVFTTNLACKNKSELTCSTVRLMVWCLLNINSWNEWADLGHSKSAVYHQHTLYKMSIGHLLRRSPSLCQRKMLADIEPRRNPIATASTQM